MDPQEAMFIERAQMLRQWEQVVGLKYVAHVRQEKIPMHVPSSSFTMCAE